MHDRAAAVTAQHRLFAGHSGNPRYAELHRHYPSIDYLRRRARRRIPHFAFEYADGGAGNDDAGIRRNWAALAAIELVPRYGVMPSLPSCDVELFGRRYCAPIGVAPMGGPAIVWPGADRCLAQAAQLARIPYTLGTVGGMTVEAAAQIAPDVLWFQLYRFPDDGHAVGFDLARRAEAAASSDQVLVAFQRSDYSLEATRGWDTMGMRGTCSMGYMLRASGVADQVLPEPYERIHNQTMAPYAHLFWSSAWQGIASGAFRRARAFVRQASRNSGGRMPPGAPHLTRARVTLETLRGAVQAGLATFERNAAEPGGLTAMNAQLALNFLKVEASELAAATVMSAMRACGLAGYRNDGDFAMGRFLRDILSAPIMINNDRILANAEAAVLMSEPPLSLSH